MRLRRTALIAALPLALAACSIPGLGSRAPGDAAPTAPAAAPTPAGPPAVSPLEQAIEVGPGTPLGTANAETAGIKAFAASGAGWSAVAEGSVASFSREGAKTWRVPVKRIDFGGGVEFAGSIGNEAFSLTIRAADCAGGAPMSATARLGGKTLASGCATTATAEQVAGIARAAAAPAPKGPKAVAAPKAAKPKAAAPKAPAAATAPAPTPTPAPAIVIPGGPTALPSTPTLATTPPVVAPVVAVPTPTPTPTPAP